MHFKIPLHPDPMAIVAIWIEVKKKTFCKLRIEFSLQRIGDKIQLVPWVLQTIDELLLSAANLRNFLVN